MSNYAKYLLATRRRFSWRTRHLVLRNTNWQLVAIRAAHFDARLVRARLSQRQKNRRFYLQHRT